jgi:hypothetical protein
MIYPSLTCLPRPNVYFTLLAYVGKATVRVKFTPDVTPRLGAGRIKSAK